MENFKSFQDFIDVAFYGLVTGGLALAVVTLRQLSKSTMQLNEKIAVVIERLTNHDIRISNLEKGKHK